jgi:hypothetical protein
MQMTCFLILLLSANALAFAPDVTLCSPESTGEDQCLMEICSAQDNKSENFLNEEYFDSNLKKNQYQLPSYLEKDFQEFSENLIKAEVLKSQIFTKSSTLLAAEFLDNMDQNIDMFNSIFGGKISLSLNNGKAEIFIEDVGDSDKKLLQRQCKKAASPL